MVHWDPVEKSTNGMSPSSKASMSASSIWRTGCTPASSKNVRQEQ